MGGVGKIFESVLRVQAGITPIGLLLYCRSICHSYHWTVYHKLPMQPEEPRGYLVKVLFIHISTNVTVNTSLTLCI